MNNQEIDEAKKVAWEAEREDHKTLATEGAAAYFNKEFPDLKHAFLKNLNMAVCLDEGTAHKDINGANKLCVAGSGILFPASSAEDRVKKVAELFKNLGIQDVTSHGGCGPAGLAYGRDFPGSHPAPEQIEEYARDWSEKVAEEIGRLGGVEAHTHIEAGDMERPPEFHTARVVYYDGIGGFNPNKEIGLPMGFMISRKFIPADYAAEELKVAVNIAFGHHGFGELFSKELPFLVVVLATTAAEVESLKKEVVEALKDNENFKSGKIKVDGVMVE